MADWWAAHAARYAARHAAERAADLLTPQGLTGISPPYWIPASSADAFPGFKLLVFGAPANEVLNALTDSQVPEPDHFEDFPVDKHGEHGGLLTWRICADAANAARAISAIARASSWAPDDHDPWIYDKRFASEPRPSPALTMSERRDAFASRLAYRAAVRAARVSPWERCGVCPPFYVLARGLGDPSGFKVLVLNMPDSDIIKLLGDAEIPQPDYFEVLPADARDRHRMLLTWRLGADAARGHKAISEHPLAWASFWTPDGYDPWISDSRFALLPRPFRAY